MEAIQWAAWALIIASATASFFLSVGETALFSLGNYQLHELKTESPKRGVIVGELLSRPQGLLATMVFGNTVAFSVMLSTAMWMALTGRWPTVPSLAGLFILILFACEVLPKTLGVRSPETWSLRVAPFLQIAHRLAFPVRWLSQLITSSILRFTVPKDWHPAATLTDEEYEELLELAFQQGALQHSEKEIILQIVSLDRKTAADVMTPRSQMADISIQLPREEMLEEVRRLKHRRLPLFDQDDVTVMGVLNTRTLMLNPTVELEDAIELPSFVPETMNLLHLLRSLQHQQHEMAIVVDEFGGTAGIVTLEDILEEVVGRVRGEPEAEGILIQRLDNRGWRLNGATRIDDFRREYPALGEVEDIETMGGLLTMLLEVVPREGESAQFRGLRLTATASDGKRVRELTVERVR